MSNSSSDRFESALAVRRDVMGAEYVDKAFVDQSRENLDFQRFVTETAWGQWTDPRLSRRERSLVTLAILATLGKSEEFELHARGAIRNGVTREELDALVLHIGAYTGAPSGIAARRALKSALA